MESHSEHSNCEGHSHSHQSHSRADLENNVSLDNTSNPAIKKNKELIYAILSVFLVVSGSLIKVYIFADFILEENDRLVYPYISWFLLFMILLSYTRTVFADHSQTFMERMLAENPKRHFNIDMKQFKTRCEFCNKIKFGRSSHCSTCKVCITRRDHHCVWINKCVGYTNNQFFINYCIWTWLAGLHYMWGFIEFYNNQYELSKRNPDIFILPIYIKIFLYLFTVIMLCGTFGISAIIISQINAIFNEASYNERRKDPHLETYYLCCQAKTYENNKVSLYFIGNFLVFWI